SHGALRVARKDMHDLAACKPACVEGDGGPWEPTVCARLNERCIGENGKADRNRSATLLTHEYQRLPSIKGERYHEASGVLKRAARICINASERLSVRIVQEDKHPFAGSETTS